MEKGNDDNMENGKTTTYGSKNANNNAYVIQMFTDVNY